MNIKDQSQIPNEKEQEILRAVKNIHYGSVEIIIHDSKIVQIDCTEKIRFDKGSGAGV